MDNDQIGVYRIVPCGESIGLADEAGWIPIMLANREAALLMIGILISRGYHRTMPLMEVLQNTYNKARPPVDVTVQHIVQTAEEWKE